MEYGTPENYTLIFARCLRQRSPRCQSNERTRAVNGELWSLCLDQKNTLNCGIAQSVSVNLFRFPNGAAGSMAWRLSFWFQWPLKGYRDKAAQLQVPDLSWAKGLSGLRKLDRDWYWSRSGRKRRTSWEIWTIQSWTVLDSDGVGQNTLTYSTRFSKQLWRTLT